MELSLSPTSNKCTNNAGNWFPASQIKPNTLRNGEARIENPFDITFLGFRGWVESDFSSLTRMKWKINYLRDSSRGPEREKNDSPESIWAELLVGKSTWNKKFHLSPSPPYHTRLRFVDKQEIILIFSGLWDYSTGNWGRFEPVLNRLLSCCSSKREDFEVVQRRLWRLKTWAK